MLLLLSELAHFNSKDGGSMLFQYIGLCQKTARWWNPVQYSSRLIILFRVRAAAGETLHALRLYSASHEPQFREHSVREC
jgi:hypothetical protein